MRWKCWLFGHLWAHMYQEGVANNIRICQRSKCRKRQISKLKVCETISSIVREALGLFPSGKYVLKWEDYP